jgi:hypothetical protein
MNEAKNKKETAMSQAVEHEVIAVESEELSDGELEVVAGGNGPHPGPPPVETGGW